MTQALLSLSFEHRVETMYLIEVSGYPQWLGEGAFVSSESAAAQSRDETLRQFSDKGSSRDAVSARGMQATCSGDHNAFVSGEPVTGRVLEFACYDGLPLRSFGLSPQPCGQRPGSQARRRDLYSIGLL